MNFQNLFQTAFQVALLKEDVLKKVATAKNFRLGLGFLALSSLAGALGPLLFPISYAPGLYFQPDLARVFGETLSAFATNFILLFVVGWAAEQYFGSKIDRFAFVAVMGYGHIVGLLALIPSLSLLSAVWIILLLFVVLKRTAKLEWGAIALLVVLLIVSSFLLNWIGDFLGMDGSWTWGRASLF